jgi:hypothetical protein
MRGMMSVAESELPSLFILVPPDLVHFFLNSDGFPWYSKQNVLERMLNTLKCEACDVYFLCIACQLTGKVMHKPIELLFPGQNAAKILKQAAAPMKYAFALLKFGMVAAQVASGGMLPCPPSFPLSIEQLNEMGEVLQAVTEKGASVAAFVEGTIEKKERGDEAGLLTLSRQNLDKMERVTAQLRLAERGDGVKSSRLLRKLLKLSTATKDLGKLEIANLAKLYRCVHKHTGKVAWISDDEDAKQRANKLGFLLPDLRLPDSDVSDVEGDETETGDRSKEVDAATYAENFVPALRFKDKVEEGATITTTASQSQGCSIL